MHRLYRTLGILSVATLALAAPRNNLLGAQATAEADTSLPATGIDFSGIFGARLPAVPNSLLARGTPQGAPFAGFTPNSPAERAGLRVGGRRGQHR